MLKLITNTSWSDQLADNTFLFKKKMFEVRIDALSFQVDEDYIKPFTENYIDVTKLTREIIPKKGTRIVEQPLVRYLNLNKQKSTIITHNQKFYLLICTSFAIKRLIKEILKIHKLILERELPYEPIIPVYESINTRMVRRYNPIDPINYVILPLSEEDRNKILNNPICEYRIKSLYIHNDEELYVSIEVK